MPDPGHIAGPIIIPNAVQIRLLWSQPNFREAVNVMHGIVAGGFVSSVAVAQAVFASIIGSGAWSDWKAKLNNAVTLEAVDIRDLRVADQALERSTGIAVAGTASGGALPPGDALVVTLRTALSGRSNRGRIYLPGLDRGALDADGAASTDTQAKAGAFVTQVKASLSASSITLAIGQPARAAYTSAKTGRVFAARSANAVAVTDQPVRNGIIDHQRRRAGRS